MLKMIKVTKADTDDTVWINTDKIVTLHEEEGFTAITVGDGDNYIAVKESVLMVLGMMGVEGR